MTDSQDWSIRTRKNNLEYQLIFGFLSIIYFQQNVAMYTIGREPIASNCASNVLL